MLAGTILGTVRKKAAALRLAEKHDMAPHEKISPSHPQMQNAPPRQPGVYWFQSETMSRALMVDVRVTNGELTVWWPNIDQPISKLKAHWRGPIPPSSGPGSR